jgi:hypothetical protein
MNFTEHGLCAVVLFRLRKEMMNRTVKVHIAVKKKVSCNFKGCSWLLTKYTQIWIAIAG